LVINDQDPEELSGHNQSYRSNNEDKMRRYGRLVGGTTTLESYKTGFEAQREAPFYGVNMWRWFETWSRTAEEGQTLDWIKALIPLSAEY
jgi:hypothetical protein